MLFSGSTFIVALVGMFIVPTSIMRSLALGAILVGIVSVAAALTLLPALLSMSGDGVNRLRVPFVGRNLGRADAAEGRFWRRDRRRRAAPAGAVPRRFGRGDAGRSRSRSSACTSARTASARCRTACPRSRATSLQRAFPVQNPEPVRIVVVGGDGAAVHSDLVRLDRRLAAEPQLRPGNDPDAPRRTTSRC